MPWSNIKKCPRCKQEMSKLFRSVYCDCSSVGDGRITILTGLEIDIKRKMIYVDGNKFPTWRHIETVLDRAWKTYMLPGESPVKGMVLDFEWGWSSI